MIEIEETSMNTIDDMELFQSEHESAILFDAIDEDEELTISGNEDFLDSVRSVCLTCGGTNGTHSPDCNEMF